MNIYHYTYSNGDSFYGLRFVFDDQMHVIYFDSGEIKYSTYSKDATICPCVEL